MELVQPSECDGVLGVGPRMFLSFGAYTMDLMRGKNVYARRASRRLATVALRGCAIWLVFLCACHSSTQLYHGRRCGQEAGTGLAQAIDAALDCATAVYHLTLVSEEHLRSGDLAVLRSEVLALGTHVDLVEALEASKRLITYQAVRSGNTADLMVVLRACLEFEARHPGAKSTVRTYLVDALLARQSQSGSIVPLVQELQAVQPDGASPAIEEFVEWLIQETARSRVVRCK